MSTQNVSVGITANTQGLSQLNGAIAQLNDSLKSLNSVLGSVQGNASNANSALSGVSSQASNTANSMNSMASGIGASSTAMAFLGGVAGGAAAIAIQKLGQLMAELNPLKFASEMAQAAGELERTANAMNMTAARAQALNDVIEDAELSQSEVTGAMRKLNMQLGENEDGLRAMGIATRDSSGALVSQEQLFQNAVSALSQYEAGTNRNAAAMEVFGRANIDLTKAALITTAAIDESQRRMKELNNEFSPERMTNAANYRQAMRDLGDVSEGLKNTIGGAMLPVMEGLAVKFADLAESILPAVIVASEAVAGAFEIMGTIFFEVAGIVSDIISTLWDAFVMLFGGLADGMDSTGKDAITWKDGLMTVISVLKQALIGFAATFKIVVALVKEAFDVIYNVVAGSVEVLVVRLMSFADAAKKAMSLDFAGARAAWDAGTAQIEQTVKKRFDNIITAGKDFKAKFDSIAAEASAKIDEAQNGKAGSASIGGIGGGSRKFTAIPKGGSGSADKEASAMLKAEQDMAKAQTEYALRIYKEGMRQEEAELKRSLDQRAITSSEYFSKLAALRDDQIATEIRLKEAEMATIREAMDKKGVKLSERLKMQVQELRLSGEVRELEMKRAETQREFAEQARKAAEQIDRQRQSLRDQIASVSGIGILESKMAAIARKFADLPKELMDSAEARTLQTLETMKARLEEFDRKQKETAEMERAKLDAMKAQGQTTEEGAKQKLLKLERDLLAAKIKNLEAELATARAAGDPVRIQMLEKEISLLNLKAVAIQEGAAEVAQVTNAMQRGFESFFTDMMNGTKSAKDAFKDLANSIVAEINSIIAKKLSNQLMESLFNSEGGGFNLGGMLQNLFGGGGGSSGASGGGGFSMGGLFSSIGGGLSSMFSGVGSMFSGLFGGFAGGGYAMSGQPYLVGENGPELFIPGASGSVMPNESMGGLGGVTVHQTINTPDANSFRRASAQVMTDYQRALGRASRRNG